MKKPKKFDGRDEPFTLIPNVLIRSKHLDAYDKLVFSIIASCNPSFPTYETVMEWSGMSRGRVWKSLRALERHRAIYRFKRGRSVVYVTYWDRDGIDAHLPSKSFGELPAGPMDEETSSPDELVESDQHIETRSPGELIDAELARMAGDKSGVDGDNSALNSSPDELNGSALVHHVDDTSSPDELETVHQVNAKKNKEKEQIKRAAGFSEIGSDAGPLRVTFGSLMQQIEARYAV